MTYQIDVELQGEVRTFKGITHYQYDGSWFQLFRDVAEIAFPASSVVGIYIEHKYDEGQ